MVSSKSLTKKRKKTFNKKKKNVRRTRNKRRTSRKRIKSRSRQRGGASESRDIHPELQVKLGQMKLSKTFEGNLDDINLLIFIINQGDDIVLDAINEDIKYVLELNGWVLRGEIIYPPEDRTISERTVLFLQEYLPRYQKEELERTQGEMKSQLKADTDQLYEQMDRLSLLISPTRGRISKDFTGVTREMLPIKVVIKILRESGGYRGATSDLASGFQWLEGEITNTSSAGISYILKDGSTDDIPYRAVKRMVVPLSRITLKIADLEYWEPAKRGDTVIYNGSEYTIVTMNHIQVTLSSNGRRGVVEVKPSEIHEILHSGSKLNQDPIILATGPHEHISPGQKIYRSNDLTGTEYRVLDVVERGTRFRVIKTGESRHIEPRVVLASDYTLLLPLFEDLSGGIIIKTGFGSRDVNTTYHIYRDPIRNGGMILKKGDKEYLLKSIVPAEGGYYQIGVIKISSSNQKILRVKFPEHADGNESHKEILRQLNESLE
jgi:hypothetical protein